MTNRLPPHRKLFELNLRGKRKMTQLEAFALLHVIRFMQAGDWLSGFKEKERGALETLRTKVLYAVAEARRLSIPKGLPNRPADAPGIFDPPAVRPAHERRPKGYDNAHMTPWLETKDGQKARAARKAYVDRTKSILGRKGRMKRPPLPE